MVPLHHCTIAACLPFCVLLSGCGASKAQVDSLAAKNSALEQQVTRLEQQLNKAVVSQTSALAEASATTQRSIELLTGEIAQMQTAMASKLASEEPAVVDPRDKGFAVTRTQYGSFAVSLDDAQSYLDGFKVRLEIGNLAYATMTNVKLNVSYGPREPSVPDLTGLTPEKSNEAIQKFSKAYTASRAARKTMTVDAGKELAPGAWNLVDVFVSPCKPEQLGRIEVLVEPEGISLRKPQEVVAH